jgi:hypothetical protein
MLLGVKSEEIELYSFRGIFGDWLTYVKSKVSDEYGTMKTDIMYNLKTGELRNVFVNDYGSDVDSKWQNGWYFEGKYYNVNSIMDYSNTGYKPGSGQRLSDFEPVTKQYLYEYDFETDTSKMLFEVFEGWKTFLVTNEKFYVQQNDDERFYIKKDGTEKAPAPKINASNFVGTYAILYNPDGFTVHNMKNDETKEVVWDHTVVGKMCVNETGVLYAHQTKYDEWDNFSTKEYRKEHPNASSTEINNAARKLLASGTAQIWKCGYMGEDNHVIFELPAARIEIISAYGEYVFAKVSKYNTETGEYLDGYNNSPCCINIATGEVTPIPELDIVVPYWYTN